TAASASSDSIIASNPVETPDGSMTPQRAFEPSEPARGKRTPPPKPRRIGASGPAAQRTQEPPAEASTAPTRSPQSPGGVVQWGSVRQVVVSEAMSSETAHPGDAWSGTLAESVFVRDHVALPAGSTVHGIVKQSKPAAAGDRALLELEVTSVDAFGNTYPM